MHDDELWQVYNDNGTPIPGKRASKEEIETLEAQIKADQEKPVRENERRVRVGTDFKDAIKGMAKASPMTNEEVAAWAKKQREEIDNLENDK